MSRRARRMLAIVVTTERGIIGAAAVS